MLKAKAIIVHGEVKTFNGLRVRDLDKKVEVALDGALTGLKPESIVDIKINTEFTGISGDHAFIVILYNHEEAVPEKETKAEINTKAEVNTKQRKKYGGV